MAKFPNGRSIWEALSMILLVSHALLAAALPTTSRSRSTPDVRLIQYVQTFHLRGDSSKRLSLLPLIRQQTSVTHVILAALHVNALAGDITLNDLNPTSTLYQELWSEVKLLQQSGVKVLVMMGGAARGSYDGRLCRSGDGGLVREIKDRISRRVTDIEQDDNYYNPLVTFITDYGLDGIDLDIEEPVQLSCATDLIQRLKGDLGADFIITMAPVASDLTPTMRGLSGFNYKELDRSSAGSLIDWYNTQYYSGFVEGSIEQSYAAAVGNGFPASRIVLGLLDSADDGNGFLGISEVKGVISNIENSYSGFGGVDGWEYFNAGSSDGYKRPSRWLKEVGKVALAKELAGPALFLDHTPRRSDEMLQMIHDGFSAIDAAIAIRYAKGYNA